MRPPTSAAPARRDLPIEGLRGLCAGLVVYAHVFAPARALDPRWEPSPRFWWFNLGSAAVLMFFVLSGYVIGLTTTGEATGEAIRRYLVRRALRLVPVVTAAVLLSWALMPQIDGRTVLGNLLFLQNSDPYPGGLRFDLMPNNPNLWSLNYEVVYYLAFVALWRWAPRAGFVWAGLAVLALASATGWPALALFSHFACGGLYWFGGLALAWSTPFTGEPRRSNWPAALLGAYALWTIAPLRYALIGAEWYALIGGTPAAPHRLDFLPACLWVLAAVAGRAARWQHVLTWFCLGWATVGFAARGVAGTLTVVDHVAAAGLVAAWLIHRWQVRTDALARLAPLGAISFGIYVIAIPIQLTQARFLPDFSGSALTFAARLAFVTMLAVTLAWALELRLYPLLRRWCGAPIAGNPPAGR